jgi:hypothetical protein
MKSSLTALAVVVVLMALGCHSRGPMAIQGTVTLDGQALSRGRIDFQPADGKGPTAAAVIRDGKYECSALPGRKTVRITGGKVVGSHHFTPDNPASPIVEDVQPLGPPCYNTATTLSCEMTRGKSIYNFELKSKP